MTSQDPTRRRALGDRVRTERELKGLSIREAARLAGVDRGTWYGVEEATRTQQSHKAAQMERVLGWAPGSFNRILTGFEPTPIPIPEPEPVPVDPDLVRAKKAYEVWIRKYPPDEAVKKLDEYILLLLAEREKATSRSSDRRDDDRPKTNTIG